MGTLIRFVAFLLFVGGWAMSALSLHLVRTPDSISLFTKERLSIDDIYVDTRTWTIDDVAHHPVVVTRMIRTGRLQLLSHLADPYSDLPLQVQVVETMERGPQLYHYPGPSRAAAPAADQQRSEGLLDLVSAYLRS